MEWMVHLNTAGLNQWFDTMEQKLTRAGNLLDLLEEEEEMLKNIWNGAAMRRWEKEFMVLLIQVRAPLGEMKRILTALDEAANTLAAREKDILDTVGTL